MYRNRVIPCLLIDGTRLVKTVRFSSPTYIGDPLNAVKIFNDKGADELLIIDIGQGPLQIDFLRRLAAQSFMPLAYGGRIRSVEDARLVCSLGFEKVCVNGSALVDPSLVTSLSNALGASSVVCGIDVKKDFFGRKKVYHKTAKVRVSDPVLLAQEYERLGAGEILLQSVDNDGVMKGYDLELISSVSSAVSVPLIALGGAGSLEDISRAVRAGAWASAAGSLFVYFGPRKAVLINYPEGAS